MIMQIFCSECNAAMDEDTKFCSECGAKVEISENIEYDTIICSSCGIKTTMEFDFCSECGSSIHQEEGDSSIAVTTIDKNQAIKASKFSIKPLYIGIAAAVIFLIGMGVVRMLTGSSSSGNNIIYTKDKELQYTYLPKLTTFEMTDRLVDNSYDFDVYDYNQLSYNILTSDDGRYIFYPGKIDGNSTYYWRDLKADNTKNDVAVRIDNDISETPVLTSDGSKFFYIKNEDNRLYVFDRKTGEKGKLDDDVSDFYVNENGDYIIYEKLSDNEYSTHEMTIKGISGEKNRIDSNSSIHEAFPDDKKVYYLKDEALYLKEFSKDKVKISSDVYQVISIVGGKSAYYLKTEEVTNKLSALINDDMASNDRDLKEPVQVSIDDAPNPPTAYDYQHDVWYASSWGSEFNAKTNEYGYWRDERDYDAYNEAYEAYQEKYNEWQVGYNEIMDKYNEEYNIYQGKENRDNLRLALDDQENAITYYKNSLYYWNNGEEKLVASDLSTGMNYDYYLATSFEKPIVIYQKYSTSTGDSHKMSEIISNWGNYFNQNDVIGDLSHVLASTRNTSEEIYVASEDKESVLESNEGYRWSISEDGSIYFLENLNTEKYDGTLMSSVIKEGVAGKPVKIDEDVMDFFPGNDNGNYYYFKDIKNSSGDLYLNGQIIASDVHTNSLYNYKGTDTLVYYSDYSENYSNGTLTILKDGNETKIADDVAFFSPIDEKNLTYLTDYNRDKEKGDLMLYNGKDQPTLLDYDVTSILWNQGMMWWMNQYEYMNLY